MDDLPSVLLLQLFFDMEFPNLKNLNQLVFFKLVQKMIFYFY